MNTTNEHCGHAAGRVTDSRTCLADLPLCADDYNALRCQGFVSEEMRSGDVTYYKLRFRRNGKQVVIGNGMKDGDWGVLKTLNVKNSAQIFSFADEGCLIKPGYWRQRA